MRKWTHAQIDELSEYILRKAAELPIGVRLTEIYRALETASHRLSDAPVDKVNAMNNPQSGARRRIRKMLTMGVLYRIYADEKKAVYGATQQGKDLLKQLDQLERTEPL